MLALGLYAAQLRRLIFENGEAGSSSNYNVDHKAANAFDDNIMTTWAMASVPLPALVWYRFNHPQRCPAKVIFSARQDGAYLQLATEFQFLGSNDPNCDTNSNWFVFVFDQNTWLLFLLLIILNLVHCSGPRLQLS